MNSDGINAKINSIGNLLISPNIYSSPIKGGLKKLGHAGKIIELNVPGIATKKHLAGK